MVDLLAMSVSSWGETHSVIVSIEHSVPHLHEKITTYEQIVESILSNV